MRALLRRIERLAAAACSSTTVRSSFHHPLPPLPLPPPALFSNRTSRNASQSDFGSWSSLGFSRSYSKFATGFTPLKAKPLESILDLDRAKNLSPEHLVSAWDDVSPNSVLTDRVINENSQMQAFYGVNREMRIPDLLVLFKYQAINHN